MLYSLDLIQYMNLDLILDGVYVVIQDNDERIEIVF